MAGPQTSFGDAIGLALDVFAHDDGPKGRVLIALTDGNDIASAVPPVRAAEIAHDRGVVIHTVAVGDPAAAAEPALDEETLRTVASTTGGRYARANDREALSRVYAELDALGTRPLETVSQPVGDGPRLTAWQEKGGAPVQVLAPDVDAAALGAPVTQVTPDDADVRTLARHATARVVGTSGDAAEGARRQDAGWWLTFGVAAVVLVWCRPGWVVASR